MTIQTNTGSPDFDGRHAVSVRQIAHVLFLLEPLRLLFLFLMEMTEDRAAHESLGRTRRNRSHLVRLVLYSTRQRLRI